MVSPPSRVDETALGGGSKAPRIPNPPVILEDESLITSNESKISLSCDGLEIELALPREAPITTEGLCDACLPASVQDVDEQREIPGISQNSGSEEAFGSEENRQFVKERSAIGEVREVDECSKVSVPTIDNTVSASLPNLPPG
jgi:hypothetical protein